MADSLKDLLTGIYVDRGTLDGETVVNEAQAPEHPLHHRFEWDDRVAGHKYRVQQAEQMIRSVKIETAPPSANDGPHYVRAFVSNRQSGNEAQPNGYQPVEEVVADPLRRRMLLRALKRQVDELQRRYGHLEEFRTILEQAAGE